MRRTPVNALLGLGLVALATGCAGPGAGPGTGTGAQPALALHSAPVDAALVTPQFGWVLSADQLLVTSDGGDTFQPAGVQLPDGPSRAAYFRDSERGWVASTDGSTVSVARTTDGGGSWRITDIPSAEPVGALSIAFGDAGKGALLARVQTSSAFSRAHLYGTSDGGASWRETGAPVAGEVTVEPGGRVWLAGGVLGNELYTTTDQGGHWTRAQLHLSQASGVAAVAPPQDGVLPVSAGDGAASRVALLTPADGADSWRESASVPLKKAAGAAVPVAVRDAAVLVPDPEGGSLHRTTTGGASSDLRATGLPAGVSHLTFATATTGWAIASTGSCAGGKQNCSITDTVVATGDGGSTWHQLTTWVEKLN